MLEIATKSWDADTTFPESVRKQDPGQAAWASWGMIQRRGEHLITMHPMSQRYLARKKCRRHCTKSQASSGHIRSSSDKLQVLPSQLGWSVNCHLGTALQFCLNFCHHARVMPQVFTNRTKTKQNKKHQIKSQKDYFITY